MLGSEDGEGEQVNTTKVGEEQRPETGLELRITAPRIQRTRFPTYVPPNVKDDMVSRLFCLFV